MERAVQAPSASEDSMRQRNLLLACMVLTYTASFVDRTIVNVLVEPIKTDLGMSDMQIGLLSGAAFGILYGVMGLPFARLADRSSRLNIVTCALGAWSLATAACGLAQNFWQFFFARMGVGIGEAGCTPSAHSMISDSFPARNRATALSIYGFGVPIGTLIGAVFGGWIATDFNWRTAFILVGLPGIAIAVAIRLLLREPARSTAGVTDGEAATTPALSTVVLGMWRSSPFRYLVLGFTFAAVAGYSINLFIVAYLQRAFGIGLVDASFAYGLTMGTTGIVGMLAGGIATDVAARRDRRMQFWVPAIALLLTPPLIILGLIQDKLDLVALTLIPAAMMHVIYMGPGFAAGHSLVPPRARATASAMLLLISTVIGMGVGPAMTGAISDAVSAWSYSGDFAQNCMAGVSTPACAQAGARGLLIALIVAASFYALAALAFLMAGFRHGRKELC